jgi:YesN/AraC family two-component response regulator
MQSDISKRLTHMQFLQRENLTSHYKYDYEMLQFEYIKNGDPRAVDFSVEIFLSDGTGKLSDDPLRNAQYGFVCAMTLTTRFAIEGGMEPETAYNTSDIYIQNADKCKTVDEVRALHRDMTEHFTKQMGRLKTQNVFSKPVVLCLDYIYEHLHQVITVEELAGVVGVNASYLSTLFKKEMGLPISKYIRRKRIESAENMLKYSDYPLTDIGEYLAFSSYSHFAEMFRKYTGFTPKEYRKRFFRKTDLITP